MKEIQDYVKRNKGIIILVILCSAIMYMQFQINPYYDDYGDLSLSYAWEGNTHRMSYNIFDIIRFCTNLYTDWTGRIATTFIGETLFMIGGWGLIQFFNGVVILSICFSAGIIAADSSGYNKLNCIISSLILYGLYSIVTLQSGFYWFAAFISYVWPMAPLLIAFVMMSNKEKNTILICILLFVCGFSDEQYAVMLFVSGVVWVIAKYFVERVLNKRDICILLTCIITTVLEITAPGNFARARDPRYEEFYNKSIFERLIENLKNLIEVNFGKYNVAFVMALIVATLLYLYWLKLEKKYIIIGFISLISTALVYFTHLFSSISTVIIGGWFFLFVIVICYQLIKRKKFVLLSIFAGALCSQGMMLIVPTIPIRAHIPMEITLNMIIVFFIGEIIIGIKEKKVKPIKVGTFVFYSLLILYCIVNFTQIFVGYNKNMEVHKINHNKLVEASLNYKNGIEPKAIRLYKLYDDIYAGEMPYNGKEFMEFWMCNYYELPQNTVFYWGDFGEDFYYSVKNGEYWSDKWMGEFADLVVTTNVKKHVKLKFNNVLEIENQIVKVVAGDKEYSVDVQNEGEIVIDTEPGDTDIMIYANTVKEEGGERNLSVVMNIAFE